MGGKSVLGVRLDGISRQLGNRSFQQGEKSSSMQFCPLQRGPNGMMASFLVIIDVLTIRVIELMVIMPPTVIFIFHGEVPCCAILVSQRSLDYGILPSAQFLLDLSVTFLYFLSSY
jgi:hypothetical protein